MSKFLPKKLSWKAWAALRAAGIVLVLGGGASLLQTEIARGSDLDRLIHQKSDEAETRIDQGARARQFHEIEEPVVREIEKKLERSVPADQNGFKAFCLTEAGNEDLELTTFRCEKFATDSSRTGSRDERNKAAKPPVSDSPFAEIPFTIQGRGNYGGVLRFVDGVQTNWNIIAIDKFAVARSSVFSQYFLSNRGGQLSKTIEEEFPPESHSFVLEGRVFVRKEKVEEGR